jgi:antitoxin VapB
VPQTTVFQSGNSQAVRLPKEFRFKSKTVEIFRRGDEVVLREKPQTLGELLDSLPPITPEESEQLRLVFEAARETRPAEDRDWAALWGGDKEPQPRSAKKTARRL